MHLSPDHLVDLAEGTRPEASAPHLSDCDRCRRQLEELRAMLSAAAATDVPDPPAEFWDRLSENVRQAVAVERPRRGLPGMSVLAFLLRPAVLFPCTAVAALVLAVLVRAGGMPVWVNTLWESQRGVSDNVADTGGSGSTIATTSTPAPDESPSETTGEDDLSLRLLGDLAENLDSDSVDEAGLAPRGSAEHEVTHLNESELKELRRLLQEELANSGA